MNLKGHKIFFSLLVIFILIGCDYSRTPPKKIEKYQYGDGHIIKDSPDKELYLEYLNERSDLETKYMTKFNNLKSKESEYQKNLDNLTGEVPIVTEKELKKQK